MPPARVTRPQATGTSAVPPPDQPPPTESFGERARLLFNDRDATATSIDNTAMAVATRPAVREQPPQPDAFIDAALYIKLKTTLEIIFVSGWGEFIQQYQFNELDDRMSKLKKGQNVTKTAEETALELDREMSMDAELTGKFITQQVAAVMADKTKQYEKKIKNWRKVEEIECWESYHQKTVRGVVDAPPRKQKVLTQMTTKSRKQHKSASQSAQGRKSILRIPSRGISQKAVDANSGTPGNKKREESSAFQKRINVDQADLENRRRQIARLVKEKARESYGFLPDKRRLAKKTCAHHLNRYGKVILLLPTHQPFISLSHNRQCGSKSTTVDAGTRGSLLPNPSPPHAQN